MTEVVLGLFIIWTMLSVFSSTLYTLFKGEDL